VNGEKEKKINIYIYLKGILVFKMDGDRSEHNNIEGKKSCSKCQLEERTRADDFGDETNRLDLES
jgi:hypothetical protein